jgi:hypothetical protein
MPCTEGPEETAPVGSYTCRLVTCSEWQLPLFGVHSILMEKLATAGMVGMVGARTPPFTTFNITYKVAVYSPAKWADTLSLIHRYQYMYSMVMPRTRNCTFMNSASVQ